MTNTEILELTKVGLAMIQQIIELLNGAQSGVITPADALDEIKRLHERIAGDRAAADAALDKKFDSP
jgi:uncharacterized protein (DUF885 family)